LVYFDSSIVSHPDDKPISLITQATVGVHRSYQAGEFIIRQGELGEEFFILMEGRCDVQRGGNTLMTLVRVKKWKRNKVKESAS